MTKREQIILAVMVLAVAIGGFLYFSGSSRQGSGKPTISMGEVDSLVGNANTAIAQKGLSQSQQYKLRMIGESWLRDPFVHVGPTGEDKIVEDAEQNAAVKFEYSAWVVADGQFVGVINGREYQMGDPLVEDGYVLVHIDTKTALIKGPGESNMIVVPYRDYNPQE